MASLGHHVVGVDINALKVAEFNTGRSPIVEAGLGELVSNAYEAGRLSAISDARIT